MAVVSGLGNTRKLMKSLESGQSRYDFVEVMACPGGCAGGGGQPIHDGEELAGKRGDALWKLDQKAPSASPMKTRRSRPSIRSSWSGRWEGSPTICFTRIIRLGRLLRKHDG